MQSKVVSLPDGKQIHCVIQNPQSTAPPLILLNGAIFNLNQWKRLVSKGDWTDHFRVIRYDYCDTGGSSLRDKPVSMAQLADELIALMDALEVPAAHFYGLSQGTIVVQALAAKAPERILSAGGYGWYYGDYSELEATKERFVVRVAALEELRHLFVPPMDRTAFAALWEKVFRVAVMKGTWEELGFWQRAKDWLMRQFLFPLVKPTPIGKIHEWFLYCIHHLEAEQVWIRDGFTALSDVPVFIQHATGDETLEVGMARELHHAVPTAKLQEYGEKFTHISVALNTAQARQVVNEHIAFLRERGTLN